MKIKLVTLYTEDINAVEQFYKKTLELPVRRNNDEVIVTCGTSILKFVLNNKIEKPVYHFAFNIPCNQLHDAVIWMAGKAELIPVEGKPIADFVNWNAQSIYFCDSVGNILEIIARNDLQNQSNKPFSPASLLCISEIAIACEVRSEVDWLEKEFSLTPFIHQPVLDNFAAVGDNDGLLILSAQNRNWYPTDIPVKYYPLEVIIENKGREIEFIY